MWSLSCSIGHGKLNSKVFLLFCQQASYDLEVETKDFVGYVYILAGGNLLTSRYVKKMYRPPES